MSQHPWAALFRLVRAATLLEPAPAPATAQPVAEAEPAATPKSSPFYVTVRTQF